MRIGINLFEFVPPGSRGAGVLRYVKNMLRGLSIVDRQNSYYLFVNSQAVDEYDPLSENFHKVVVPLDARKRWTRVVWEQVLLPFQVHRLGLDVIHSPTDTIALGAAKKAVVTSYATNISYYQQRFPNQARGIKQRYLLMMQHLLTKAAAIITISQHSKHEIVRHLGGCADKIRVIYPAPDGAVPTLASASAKPVAPYILCVSSSVVHKNLPALIRAYGILREKMPDAPKLVIAGFIAETPTWGMHRREDLEQCARAASVANDVVFEAQVSETRLQELYRGATLFVFPSLYEGFGLVVMEAMCYGLPVVTSDRASLPEVGGDAVVYVNPEEPSDIAVAMERVLRNPDLRLNLGKRGVEQAQTFGDWTRVAAQTLAVYEEVGRRTARD